MRPPAECAKTIQSLFLIVLAVLALDTNSVFRGPDLPFFISSLTSNPKDLSMTQLIPFVTFHVYIWTHVWVTYFFYSNILLCYVTIIRNALRQMR